MEGKGTSPKDQGRLRRWLHWGWSLQEMGFRLMQWRWMGRREKLSACCCYILKMNLGLKNDFYIYKGSLVSGPLKEQNWTWMKTSCLWGFLKSWKMCCFYWKDFYLITSRVCSISTKTQVTLFVSKLSSVSSITLKRTREIKEWNHLLW